MAQNKKTHEEIIKHKAIWDKPKYRIGDVIVYYERSCGAYRDHKNDSMLNLIQSKIVSARAYIETENPDDRAEWHYHTEETKELGDDSICDSDIIQKLNGTE